VGALKAKAKRMEPATASPMIANLLDQFEIIGLRHN